MYAHSPGLLAGGQLACGGQEGGYHGITLPPAPDPKKTKPQGFIESQAENPIAAKGLNCSGVTLHKAFSPPLGRPRREFACVVVGDPAFRGSAEPIRLYTCACTTVIAIP